MIIKIVKAIDFLQKKLERWKRMQKWRKYRLLFHVTTAITVLITAVVILAAFAQANKELITPVSTAHEQIRSNFSFTAQAHAKELEGTQVLCKDELCMMDFWIGHYTDKFFESPTKKSEVRMIMQCLAHRESKHNFDKGHGDGGKAGGPFQFHNPTYIGYRKIMMDSGLVDELGSRYEVENAIETTVWAIKTGRAKAWGPIYRDANGSDFATCPTPSWY